MKKTIIFTVLGIIIALAVTAVTFHQIKSNELDELVKTAQEQDRNYTPPEEELIASERYQDLKGKYPKFFAGGGMQEVDFQVRTELGSDHQNRLSEQSREHYADSEAKWEEFKYVLGAREKVDTYVQARNNIIEKTIQIQMGYDLERMELFDEAVKFCESEDQSISTYLSSTKGSEEYLRQLGFVLYNAKENLCSKL